MCGIAGWYSRNGPVASDVLNRQADTIVHRGPDDSGVFADADFGFAMRRLSIIDLAGGHQPIFSADGRYGIVQNGEIYNHRTLRRELEADGFVFQTDHSDTEVILAAFIRWGADAWLRLEGMYAAAIWDRRERVLTLARDPLGIKPLHLTRQNGGIAFASEIRALRVLPGHSFTIDDRAVDEFFTYGHVVTPRSIYREVTSLEPGTTLTIGRNGDARAARFWQPRMGEHARLSEAEWIEETRRHLRESVEHHMVSDVEVGSFMSGGVDSSAITAVMAGLSPKPVKVFTVAFPGSSIDESERAAAIARHLKAEHIVLPLEPAATGDLLPAVQAAFDEPCAATSAVPHWHLARLASQHVKVVLCGEGSDEIFAGYKRQRTALAAARMRPLLRAIDPALSLLGKLPEGFAQFNYLRQNARKFADSARLESTFQQFFAGTQMTTPGLRAQIYEPAFHAANDPADAFARMEAEHFPDPALRHLDPLEQFMLADITVHMPSSLLHRLDRTSMAHSLEARVPFLSHRFVDWTLTMPREMKLRGRTGKYALRKAVEPWLFPGALETRKLGFQLPFKEWFRGDFADFAQAAWSGSDASRAGYLQPAAVERLFAQHRAGTANHGRLLYAVAMFAIWWEQSFRSDPVELQRVSAC